MNRYAVQLISRGAINKMGNMLYDYGNSVWLASMGTIGQTVLGMYQISELVTSIIVNPFGGVISDRFSRRKILMTADLVCGILCLAISFIRNDSWMIGALIVANIVQAIAFAFSRTANKAIITEVVEKDEIVIYNSRLELVLQVVGVSSPVLSFLVLQFASLHMTLLLDSLTFFIAFVLVAFLPCFTVCKSPYDATARLADFFHCFCSSGFPSKRGSKSSREKGFYWERYFCRYQGWVTLYLASARNFLLFAGSFQR
ncbi:macrolide efflux ABC transporter membrane-spanning permease [Streptococcus pneumoniae]|nr:macrolide efflux ABC transporter membrane-spanning permease [Streptococcus pneumoniae]